MMKWTLFGLFIIMLITHTDAKFTNIGEWGYKYPSKLTCPPFSKIQRMESSEKCVTITASDVLESLLWLTRSRSNAIDAPSFSATGGNCSIWSVRIMPSPSRCFNNLGYEKIWVKFGCNVHIVLLRANGKCVKILQSLSRRGNIQLHTKFPTFTESVDVLRINDNGAGGSAAFLAAMKVDNAYFPVEVRSISLELIPTKAAFTDDGSRETTAHGWHLWLAKQALMDGMFVPTSVRLNSLCDPYEHGLPPVQMTGLFLPNFRHQV